MDKFLDDFFYSVSGSMGVYIVIINGILGSALIVAGVLMNKSTFKKRIVGAVCIGIGLLTLICQLTKLLFL